MENIFMRNCNVGIVKDSVLQIDFLYEEGIKGDYKPVAKNVAMDNITVAHTPRVLNVRGFPARRSAMCESITRRSKTCRNRTWCRTPT